ALPGDVGAALTIRHHLRIRANPSQLQTSAPNESSERVDVLGFNRVVRAAPHDEGTAGAVSTHGVLGILVVIPGGDRNRERGGVGGRGGGGGSGESGEGQQYGGSREIHGDSFDTPGAATARRRKANAMPKCYAFVRGAQ